jgi:subfamily B ATP-binding cassette protein MsbA
MLFMINTKLSLLMLIAAPISFTIVTILVNSIKRKATRSSIQIAGLTTILQEMLSGIKIVKSFIAEKKESLKFKKSNNRFFKLIMQQEKLRFLNAPINEMIGVILGAVLLWIGGLAVLSSDLGTQSLEAEKFVRFIIFLFAMLQPARKLTGVASIMQQGIASAERVFSILDVKLDTKKSTELVEIKDFNSSIEFQNVSFTYESSNKPAINNINFTIDKGNYIALIGESGAGKSTTIDLLMRFYDPSKGNITIDGTNLKKLSKKSLRKHIGIVPQDIILFNDTVKNNISYGFENPEMKDIKEAAKAANAIDFINELPDGFDTIIGERGTKLSGGQKQRLSIARAIFKNPKILILDEATSSLDSESEQKVKNAIDNLVKDRTVIVIAHRLSTIINSDKILVFENGSIIDSGAHDELINRSSAYKKLYNLQFKTKNE